MLSPVWNLNLVRISPEMSIFIYPIVGIECSHNLKEDEEISEHVSYVFHELEIYNMYSLMNLFPESYWEVVRGDPDSRSLKANAANWIRKGSKR
jgi:hypothetical protein